MSNKSEIQANNADIQALIDKVKALPEAESLDEVLDEQDNLITQIAEALEDKVIVEDSGSNSGNNEIKTCTITVSKYGDHIGEVFFTPASLYSPDGYITVTNEAQTIEVVCGTMITAYHNVTGFNPLWQAEGMYNEPEWPYAGENYWDGNIHAIFIAPIEQGATASLMLDFG